MTVLDICRSMRKDILLMTKATGSTGAHIGGAMSLVEIMYALYFAVADYKNDCIILSKGHGVMAWYAVFNQLGLLKKGELESFKKNETRLYAHPTANSSLPIEFASGSLGQGLSLGVGEALADKMLSNTSKTYVIIGDGECDEGQIWEAAMSASHFKLDNLVAIVDLNKIQYDGQTSEIMSLGSIEEKWKSFGWDARFVDGHNVSLLIDALSSDHSGKPLVVIASTIKGKGVSFMENNPLWHNHSLTDEQYLEALKEIDNA